MGGAGLGAGLGGVGGMGVGVGVVEVVDDELVKERKRKDFGNGIGNSSWWCVFTRIGVVSFVVWGNGGADRCSLVVFRNHLLIDARRERGPQWDVNTQS